MRLWTIHPRHLDARGIVALWREGLLARKVLAGRTVGYRHHPQLHRFQAHASPKSAINAYLKVVLSEADARGYVFNRRKAGPVRRREGIGSTSGQLRYEWRHLLRKLRSRNPPLYRKWRNVVSPEPHPLFRVKRGPVEPWEAL